jgi:hypothetical protein
MNFSAVDFLGSEALAEIQTRAYPRHPADAVTRATDAPAIRCHL